MCLWSHEISNLEETQSHWRPDLELQSLQNCKECVLFISCPVCGNLVEQPEWTKTLEEPLHGHSLTTKDKTKCALGGALGRHAPHTLQACGQYPCGSPGPGRVQAGMRQAETPVSPPGPVAYGPYQLLCTCTSRLSHHPSRGERPLLDRTALRQTLLFQLLKQAQAGDAGPREDDVVLARRVPAQAPGDHAVQLGLILERIQPIWAPAFLQVDVNLKQEHTGVSVSPGT